MKHGLKQIPPSWRYLAHKLREDASYDNGSEERRTIQCYGAGAGRVGDTRKPITARDFSLAKISFLMKKVLGVHCATDEQHKTMGKKRKAGGKPPTELREEQVRQNVRTKYDVDEQFADSEDEFFAGRDKILLDEGPASKRSRKLDEQGNNYRDLRLCLQSEC